MKILDNVAKDELVPINDKYAIGRETVNPGYEMQDQGY